MKLLINLEHHQLIKYKVLRGIKMETMKIFKIAVRWSLFWTALLALFTWITDYPTAVIVNAAICIIWLMYEFSPDTFWKTTR